MTPGAGLSTVLLDVTPHVSEFVGRLFGVERELASLAERGEGPLAALAFQAGLREEARPQRRRLARRGRARSPKRGAVATTAISAMSQEPADILRRGTGSLPDEELSVAKAVVLLAEVDDIARKAAKAGGAQWTPELRERAVAVRARARGELEREQGQRRGVQGADPAADRRGQPEDRRVRARCDRGRGSAIAARITHDPAHHWPSLHQPKNLDYQHLVELRRPEPKIPELFVGPDHERRERDGFALTDRRGDPRMVEQEIDYCLLLPRARQGLVQQGPPRQQDERDPSPWSPR